jgi:polysaccharide biosynthesis/export protein
MRLRPSNFRLVAAVTAQLYFAAVLLCTAPAAGQGQPPSPSAPWRTGDLETSPGQGKGTGDATGINPSRGSEVRTPVAPADSGGYPHEDLLDPNEYTVGPGDLVGLNFWGAQNFSHTLRIDPQGRLFIPNVGFVAGRGLTLAALEKAVAARVNRVYPRLQHGIVLLKPRTFLVQVAGLVRDPNAFAVSATTRVGRVLTFAGGRLPGGSLRRIEVRRQGKVLTADLQRFYQQGDKTRNPYLLEGDVVYVPPAELEARLEGAVHRPGSYELLPGGTLADLIEAGAGLSRWASRKVPVRVLRQTDGERWANLAIGTLGAAGMMGTPLANGDVVIVPATRDAQRKILVQGAIAAGPEAMTAAAGDKRLDASGSGAREVAVTVPFFEGDSVRTVIERAGGLLPWADPRQIIVERRHDDGKLERLEVDGHALFVLRDLTRDPPARGGDAIFVPSVRESVMVSGPVHRPGLYQFNPRFSATDYIYLAGGPTPQGAVKGTKVIRKDGGRVDIAQAPKVAPGEIIAVKQRALTTVEWVNILLAASSLLLSGAAIAITLRK